MKVFKTFKILFSLSWMLMTTPTSASFNIQLADKDSISLEEINGLKKRLNFGLVKFNEFSPIHAQGDFKVLIAGEGVRTGYHHLSRSIRFPDLEGVKKMGLLSDSVVFHELFHQLLCQVKEDLCHNLANFRQVLIHEALADYFAYLVRGNNSNLVFGENYYHKMPFIRSWNNDYNFHLVDSAYDKAAVLVRSWIKSKTSLRDLLKLVYEGVDLVDYFSTSNDMIGDILSYQLIFTGQKQSKFRRYKVSKANGQKFSLVGNKSYETISKEFLFFWHTKESEETKSTCRSSNSSNIFEFNDDKIIAKGEVKQWEKVFLFTCLGEKIIGKRSFYFKIKE